MTRTLKDELEYIMYISDSALQTRALELANTVMDPTSDSYTKIIAKLTLDNLVVNYLTEKAPEALR